MPELPVQAIQGLLDQGTRAALSIGQLAKHFGGRLGNQAIVLNRRQAGVAIEGVLKQQLAELSAWPSTLMVSPILPWDSPGFWGSTFVPRLAGFSRRKLYLPRGVSVPARLEPIVERLPLGRVARTGWDGLQHVAASLQSGYGWAATIIERHGSAARGKPVYECGTLVSKITRSVFMLDYLVNSEFRREIDRLLAQGESLYALQRALMAGRIEAEIAANLTQYPVEHLAHIAPVAHRHINMRGIMRFSIEAHHQLAPPATGKGQKTARPVNSTT